MKHQNDNLSTSNETTAGSSERSRAAKIWLLDSLLTSLYQPVMRAWLKRRLNAGHNKYGSQPEEEECRRALLMINSLWDEPGSADKAEDDPLHAPLKEKTIWLKGYHPKLPVPGGQAGQGPGQLFNLLYLRIWDTNRQDTAAVLRHFHQRLKTGGLLILEAIRFSGFTAYPYHYSFSRTVDLIAELETDKAMPEQWPELLNQNGFGILDRVSLSSAFLPRRHNPVISHCLETFRTDILQRTRTAREEIDALMPSLKQFEEQKDTLICRPGVHLMLARKI
ncbi:MAG: hypothetical protein H6573_25715 [Lewinellaceae bacterium]|nr:hypothetical protein [Phaeodactylibacter sp.]MCB9350875.1 hypothetical protein [Lewinellaceae bacterium]